MQMSISISFVLRARGKDRLCLGNCDTHSLYLIAGHTLGKVISCSLASGLTPMPVLLNKYILAGLIAFVLPAYESTHPQIFFA